MNYYNNPITDRIAGTSNLPQTYQPYASEASSTAYSRKPRVPDPSSIIYSSKNPITSPEPSSSVYSSKPSALSHQQPVPSSYRTISPPVSNLPPSYNKRPLSSSTSRESFQRESSNSKAPPYYNGPPQYNTAPRNYSPAGRGENNMPPKDITGVTGGPPGGGPDSRPQNTSSPIQKYKSPEDYHYDYRGGFRPIVDSDSRDGYTTDGSGSGIREGSVRGFENFRYPAERESLLSGESNPFFSTRSNSLCNNKESGEKQPFLGTVEPVKLTPSWEQKDVSKEELNFKNVKTFENFEVDSEPPVDRLALIFLVFVLHGIGTLMPWNMFITAKNYFVNYKLDSDTVDASEYRTNFLAYLGYASQVPNVFFNWMNIFFQMGGNLTTRIVWSILIEVVIFIVTVALAMVDSSDWPGIFFWVTMVSVVILNIANGIYQNTIYGLAARLPFKYTGAVVLGSNVSGTFTAVINIIAIAIAPNQRTSAIYYFITALFILLACFDTYFALPLNKFYRYHDAIYQKSEKQALQAAGGKGKSNNLPKVWKVFKKAFPQLFNVFMVFFVTLAVFPAVLADTCRTQEDFFISSKYFQAVTCFLTFNLFAMLGNMLPGLFMWPGPRFLCIPVLLRLFFIPAFVLCHYYPYDVERVMPVLIDSDWAFWVLAIMLGLTSGYFSSLAMMYCPRTVEPELAPIAGMMGAASLITGIFAGINFQVVCSYVVTNISFEVPGLQSTFRNCTDRLVS